MGRERAELILDILAHSKSVDKLSYALSCYLRICAGELLESFIRMGIPSRRRIV